MEYTIYYWAKSGWVIAGEVWLPNTFPVDFNIYNEDRPPLRFIRSAADGTLDTMRQA